MSDLEDPSTWCQIVEECHRSRLTEKPSLSGLLSRLIHADSSTRNSVWRTEFIDVVTRCLLDEYFCGFTKEDLGSKEWEEQAVIHVSGQK